MAAARADAAASAAAARGGPGAGERRGRAVRLAAAALPRLRAPRPGRHGRRRAPAPWPRCSTRAPTRTPATCGTVYEPPFTALTGAFGEGEGGPGIQPSHPQWEALARALLEAGADPNDEQTLYNRMFRPDDSHLELLFEFGLDDADEPLLDQLAGRSSTGSTTAWSSCTGTASTPDAGRCTAPARGGRTARQLARWTGRTRTAAADRGLGYGDELEREDAVVAAVLAADEAELDRLTETHPGVLERARAGRPGLVAWAASIDAPDAVRLAVRARAGT